MFVFSKSNSTCAREKTSQNLAYLQNENLNWRAVGKFEKKKWQTIILNDFIYDIIGDGERETMTAPPPYKWKPIELHLLRERKETWQKCAAIFGWCRMEQINSAQEGKH